MAELLSVWVSDHPSFSPEVLESWVNGLSVHDAAARRQDTADFPRISPEIVLADTRDQYMLFRQLEPFFHEPRSLAQQDIYPLSEDDCRHLLFSYYQYDANFMLLILGKQLSKGMRKDLDELADETHLALTSCNRQFDNLRRIWKAVEDQPGPLVNVIQQQFLLNPSQAKDYAAMVFITDNRLAVDKKVLSAVPLSVFLDCAHEFMRSWTSVNDPHGNDQDLQKRFLQELRELKYNITGSREVLEHFNAALRANPPAVSASRLAHVYGVVRRVIQIGGGLSYSKEWRDIFEDLEQEVVQPLREDRWTLVETGQLMKTIKESYHHAPLPADLRHRAAVTFDTFIDTVGRVIAIMM
ncbi:fibpl protein [Salpingoeca rosetta]|uniref:Fibpl protein n=1 Tax=Salpingoeca rosetta (strain ATCC 50818 / BSB-021) TaxID=946362 RepID=F2UKZ9_SALR5|nr:fibpl protein [Salpingoeca rosetta]EGD77798.1 fibpl protein [Salpingoeca rosetta]|eukprot:XP_004990274.1 fibpl protein [Salpingoeca rosetta]